MTVKNFPRVTENVDYAATWRPSRVKHKHFAFWMNSRIKRDYSKFLIQTWWAKEHQQMNMQTFWKNSSPNLEFYSLRENKRGDPYQHICVTLLCV